MDMNESKPSHLWVTADGRWGTLDQLRIVKVERDVIEMFDMYTAEDEPEAVAALAWAIGESVAVTQ